MKTYIVEVKLHFVNYGIEAETEEEALEIVKDSFMYEHNIDLEDDEMKVLEEKNENSN